MGKKFERATEAWTPERLADFLERRYRLLTEAEGNICTPGEYPSYRPFYDDTYEYRKDIGMLESAPWPDLMKLPAKQLLHPNPFELSTVRTSRTGGKCYRCWDSAIAIQACDLRGATVTSLSKVPAIRNINSHWHNTLHATFGHVGPLGPGGKVLRPTGPFVLDLTAMGDFGWTIREAAHVLAHLRADIKPSTSWIDERNKVGWHNTAALTEIAYGLLFDVPIDVTAKDRGRPGEPDTYYGVELKSSTYVQSPMIRMPINGREAARPDETLAVMLFGVFVEPVPYGLFTRSTAHRPEDRWACGPSLIACVGWECMDYISHMPLGKFAENAKSPVNYVLRGLDLLPPEDHWAYLALAKRDRPPPDTGPGSRWRYVRDWIESEEYQELRARTPALPCEQCYLINRETDGAPKHPRGKRPKVPKARLPAEWKLYDEEIDHCLMLIEKSVAEYEPLYYSRTGYPKLDRKKRRAAHNKKLKELAAEFADAKLLEGAMAKMSGKRKGNLTSRQLKRYEQYKSEQKNDE